jgi:hypothetical protein
MIKKNANQRGTDSFLECKIVFLSYLIELKVLKFETQKTYHGVSRVLELSKP